MKKILFAAFAATLLAAGCQKTEVIGTTDHGPAMTFSTEMKKITKAEGDETPYTGELPEGDVNLQANGFKIWAFADYDLAVNSNSVASNRIYDDMSGDIISYDNETWEPKDKMEYYWPAEGRYLMFFAISAKEGTIPDLMPTHGINDPYPSENQEPDFVDAELQIQDFKVDYSNPSNDLMIADFRTQNSGTTPKPVKLQFNHALTKVQFVFTTTTTYLSDGSVDPAAPKVYVQKVEVKDLCDMGDLTVQPTTPEPDMDNDGAFVSPISLSWSNQEESTGATNNGFTAIWPNNEPNFPNSYESENGSTITVKENEKFALLLTDQPKSFATWFMLPQPLDVNKMVTITYVINNRQFSARFPLIGSNKQITAWGVNQYVKYNISLTPDMILFDADVEEWEPNNTGGNGESLQD